MPTAPGAAAIAFFSDVSNSSCIVGVRPSIRFNGIRAALVISLKLNFIILLSLIYIK